MFSLSSPCSVLFSGVLWQCLCRVSCHVFWGVLVLAKPASIHCVLEVFFYLLSIALCYFFVVVFPCFRCVSGYFVFFSVTNPLSIPLFGDFSFSYFVG